MSESRSENGTPETGLVSDEQLPEDLQPDKNPLARDPDDPDHPDQDDGSSGASGPKVEGMPDMGEPGAGA
jgi:hypothetical protein